MHAIPLARFDPVGPEGEWAERLALAIIGVAALLWLAAHLTA